MSAVLDVKDINFSYVANRPILKNVSFSLRAGELINLLGRNGCGKTTLLECLAGNRRASGGSILLNGKEISACSTEERAKKISVVYQEHNAPFPYAVLDVVKMGRTPYIPMFGGCKAEDTAIAWEALRMVGLEHLADRAYTQISGGERQMVLIARALAQQTGVVLLDEPTSHLDFRNQTLIMKTIHELVVRENIAVLMSTHSPYQALMYDSSTMLMKDGRVVALGNSRDVINDNNLSDIYDMQIHVTRILDAQTGAEISACIPFADSIPFSANDAK